MLIQLTLNKPVTTLLQAKEMITRAKSNFRMRLVLEWVLAQLCECDRRMKNTFGFQARCPRMRCQAFCLLYGGRTILTRLSW